MGMQGEVGRCIADLVLGVLGVVSTEEGPGALHQIGDAPTDLSLHPHSPGYRLILNNVLFPAAKKKELKT